MTLALSATLFLTPAFVSPALAATHSVTLLENGTSTKYTTPAATVEVFLRERKIAYEAGDFLSVPRDTGIADEMTIEYRAGSAYHVITDGSESVVTLAADTVGDVLKAAHIVLGPFDEVVPAVTERAPADGAVRVTRINMWDETKTKSIPRRTEVRLEATLPPGRSQTLDAGADGVQETTYHFVQRGSDAPVRTLAGSRVARAAKPRVVVRGLGEYEAFRQLAQEGISTSLSIAGTALRMIATAYIPQCYGCSGITKIGLPAGHGVVAVDPRVIPLGTKLYIPGYGRAVAGDIGSAIKGGRIDLGFNHLGDALRFGRREITVYIVER
jgi:3D (Asp-Asp-Asp) domain-containing protein